MRKLYKFGPALCALPLLLSGCSDLEVYPRGDTVGSEKIKEYAETNPSVAAQMIESQFRGMYSWLYTPESGGTTAQSDFGQKSYDLELDMLSGDLTKETNNYGWFSDIIKYTSTQNKSNTDNYMPWRFYYRLIFTANGIIDSLGGDEATFGEEDVENRHSMGQCLGLRGFAYYYLTQCFSNEYKPSEKLVPIYRSLSEVNLSQSTQKEVYDRAISDLTKAAEYLKDFEKSEPYQIDANVAKAYLAYAYAAIGDYQNVKKYTSEIIKSGKYRPFSVSEILYSGDYTDIYEDSDGNWHSGEPAAESGMGNVYLPGVMWGHDLTEDMGINLISFSGHIDAFSYSYASAGDPIVMNSDVFALFRDDDIRKGQFDQGVFISNLAPVNKFYNKDRILQGQRYIGDDLIYLRYDEIVLLDIEADAFLGNEADAKRNLKDYLSFAPDGKKRIEDVSYIDALSGEALKDEICTQQRLELFGEGKAIMTIRRFKKTVTFGENRFDPTYIGKSMAWNDPLMHFLIPENEEINNPNLYK